MGETESMESAWNEGSMNVGCGIAFSRDNRR